MKLENIRNKLNKLANQNNETVEPHTSTVSWLYPGQFTYCLNEQFLWEKYKTMINIVPDVHFHKIQPVIRWADYLEYFSKQESVPNQHLTQFEMGTIGGGHIIDTKNAEEVAINQYRNLFKFLEELGLKKEKFKISVFKGNTYKNLGKKKDGSSKFQFDNSANEDTKGLELLLSNNITESQIFFDDTRNSYLIPDWCCGEIAPWGYRHEILYNTGSQTIDIATIERLDQEPIYQEGKIIGIKPWHKNFIISGAGLERLEMVSEGHENIREISTIKPLEDLFNKKTKYTPNEITSCVETIRTLHRIIADSDGNMRDERSKKRPSDRIKKYNKLLRNLTNVDEELLNDALTLNANLNSYYKELKNKSELVLEEVERIKKC